MSQNKEGLIKEIIDLLSTAPQEQKDATVQYLSHARFSFQRLKDIKQILSEKIKNELKYEPYVGVAGPTDIQVEHNNKVLMQELDKYKIPYKYIDIGKTLELNETLMVIVIEELGKRGKIAYDRWGYSNDTGILDQASLIDTVHYIRSRYNYIIKKKQNEKI